MRGAGARGSRGIPCFARTTRDDDNGAATPKTPTDEVRPPPLFSPFTTNNKHQHQVIVEKAEKSDIPDIDKKK